MYFVQGILGLSKLALSFFFKDELGLTPAQVAVLTGLSGLPWVVKPLYGFISDSIPLLGYRRRSYLVLCGLLGTRAASMGVACRACSTNTLLHLAHILEPCSAMYIISMLNRVACCGADHPTIRRYVT